VEPGPAPGGGSNVPGSDARGGRVPAGAPGGAGGATPAPDGAPTVPHPPEAGQPEIGGRGPVAPAQPLPPLPPAYLLPEQESPWGLWWSVLGPEYLDPRGALAQGRVISGSAESFLGTQPVAPTGPAAWEGPQVERALEMLLAAAGGDDLRVAIEAHCALGELDALWPTDGARRQVRAALRAGLASASQELAEAAATGFAAGARDDDVADLADLLLDGPRGQELCGSTEVPVRLRALAALGLARAAERSGREDLRRLVAFQLLRGFEAAPDATSELRSVCLLALARLPLETIGLRDPGGVPEPPSTSRLATLRFLLERYEDPPRRDDGLRTQLPAALALAVRGLPATERSAVAPSVVGPLLEVLARPRKYEREELEAAAAALGALGDWDDDEQDREIRLRLLEQAEAADLRTRTVALLALAQALSNPGQGPVSAHAREIGGDLARRLQRGRTTDRPAVALGLGIAAARLRAAGTPPPPLWVVARRGAQAAATGPEERSALALGSGLARDLESELPVSQLLTSLPAREERGLAATGLGLLASTASLPPLRALADQARRDPGVYRRAAVALALAGDAGLLDRLAREIETPEDTLAAAAAVDALAELGGPAEAALVLDLIAAPRSSGFLRARAIRALPRLLDPAAARWSLDYARWIPLHGVVPVFWSEDRGSGLFTRLR
jgi:hypothetical protein